MLFSSSHTDFSVYLWERRNGMERKGKGKKEEVILLVHFISSRLSLYNTFTFLDGHGVVGVETTRLGAKDA